MKPIIIVLIASLVLSIICLPFLLITSILSPNIDQSPNLFKQNKQKVKQYTDDFLDDKLDKINKEYKQLEKTTNKNRKDIIEARIKLTKSINQYNKMYFKIDKKEEKIKILTSKISNLNSQIKNCNKEGNKDKKDNNCENLKAKRNRLQIKKDKLQKEKNNLNDKIKGIAQKLKEANQKYRNLHEGKTQYVANKFLGLKDEKLEKNLKENINLKTILEIHRLLRPDGKIEDKSVKVEGLNFRVNSKKLIHEILEHSIEYIEYKKPKYIFYNQAKKPFGYSREIKIVKEVTKDLKVKTKTIKIEKIHYFQAKRVRNYYIKKPAKIINSMLKEDTYLSKLLEQKDINKEDIIKTLENRLSTNWSKYINKDYSDIKDLEKSKQKIKDRKNNRDQLLRYTQEFKDKEIHFVPGNKLKNVDIKDLKKNLQKKYRIKIKDQYEKLDLEIKIGNEYKKINIKDKIPEIKKYAPKMKDEYITLSKNEKYLWEKAIKFKNEYVISRPENRAKTRSAIPGSRCSAKLKGKLIKPGGLGHIGVLQYLAKRIDNFEYIQSIEELYDNSISIFLSKPKPGDIGLSGNPKLTNEIKIGIYTGNGKYLYFEEDTQKFVEKDNKNFNIHLAYYPYKEGEKNDKTD